MLQMKESNLKHLKIAFVSLVLVLMNALLVVMVANGEEAAPGEPPHWTYEGAEGPEFWGDLDPRYALCSAGRAQSPIDLTGVEADDLVGIGFHYNPSALNIFNNGHTIQVKYDEGSSVTYNENEYQLAQFHFHHPSEHTVNGEVFDMELHFVHLDAAGNVGAVVGVMLKQGEADNPAFASMFDNLPAEKGDPQPTNLMINAADLLPESALYSTYTGSLTTPPCTQNVRWLVLTTPVELSEAQFEAFATLFEFNARPVQPLNTRDLLEDTAADS
jgi:carbonic anhydrase